MLYDNIVMSDAGCAGVKGSIYINNVNYRNIEPSFENNKISKLLKSPHYLGRNYNNKRDSTKYLKNKKICESIDYLWYYDGTSIIDKIKQTAAKIQGVHIDYHYLDGGGATSEIDYIIDLQYFQDLCPYCHNIDYDHVCQNLDRCDDANASTKPDDDIVTPLAKYMKRPRKFKRLNRTACSLHRN